jgi:SNF2 family DNA or RNA helicase
MDVNSYVDTEKANENIKALLEGAFEDDEEGKPVKSKSKKKGKKKLSKKAKAAEKVKSTEPAKAEKKDASDDLDDLAAQLEGVTVNDTKTAEPKPKELDIKVPGTSEEASKSDSEAAERSDVVDSEGEDEEDDAEAENDEEDDEEEEEDDDEDAIIPGLKVNLLPHQVEGVKWMCNKETGQRTTKGIYPKGGILADDMGLGKTVQAIALILQNNKSEYENSDKFDSSAAKKDDYALPTATLSKTTLVVAPLALIKQWEGEILDKIEKTHRLRVCVYHGTNRAKTATSLGDYDVVITTYGTLTSESGTAAADKAKKSGIFSVYWYRVILDEAHTIKNRNAKATQAAYSLDAKFRWCLTGTPMQNNLDELQSLIRFLRIKPYDELAAWRDQISRPLNNGRGGLAIQRLQIYLKAFMKRRTKDVLKNNDNMKAGADGKNKKSNGFHIVKREVIRVDGELMEGELNFYKRLEKRTENRLEEMMGGKLDYAGALVLLLRLRQACNHPDLVKSDLAADKDVLLQNGNTGSQSKETKSNELDDVADLFGALSVVTKKCDVCQTELSQEEGKSGASRCGECETNLNTDFMTKTKKDKSKKKKANRHRKETAPEADPQAARSRKNRRVILDSDDEEEDAEWIVPEDKRDMPNLGKAGGSDDEDAEGGGDWLGVSDSDTEDEIDSPSRKKSQPIILSDSGDETASGSESDEDIYETPEAADGVLPSTKIRQLMKILNKESADYKFIVFSVFTSMLDKVEPFLKRANIGFARYDGGMRNDHREASLNKLRNNSGTRVLLCSLRAGALGLNLTAASRVVIMEPFWNPVCFQSSTEMPRKIY